jgi:pyrroline-5-carboxylate reductase
MKIDEYRIGFMGFGHLAKVIFTALFRAKLLKRSNTFFLNRDPHKMKASEQEFGITSTSLKNLVDKSDLLFLCMRPQQADLAMKELKKVGGFEGKKIITLLAGKEISYYQEHLGKEIEIVRAMPNIASSLGEGMTILTFSPNASSDFKSIVKMLSSSLGDIAEIKEDLMDMATAMAGSGLGFIFRLIDAMAKTGERAGMDYETALKISAQTFKGASSLILKGGRPKELYTQIATPNGVTEAGFNEMTKTDIDTHFASVIEAARNRSKELSNS